MRYLRMIAPLALLLAGGCAAVPDPAGALIAPLANPGQLPQGMEPDTPEFADFARSLVWGNGMIDSNRVAVGGRTTTLMIDALVRNGHLFQPSARRALVARIVNLGPETDLVYGTSADPAFVHYIVARLVPGGRAQWEMYAVDHDARTSTHVKTGGLWRCHRRSDRPLHRRGAAAFKETMEGHCDPVPGPGEGGGRTVTFSPTHASGSVQAPGTESGWFACVGYGCCVFDDSNNPY